MATPNYYEHEDKTLRPIGSEWPSPVIDVFHLRTHEAVAFEGGHLWNEANQIAAGGEAVIVLDMQANNHVHFNYVISVGQNSEAYYYTDVTENGDGSPAIVRNRVYYGSDADSHIVMTYGNTVTDWGNAFPGELIPGGRGPNASGAAVGGFSEYSPGMGKHAIRVINRGTQPMKCSIKIHWYQKTPRTVV